MPSGHTDTATINQRRPLTDNMKRVLEVIGRFDQIADTQRSSMGHLHRRDCTEGEKNAIRALIDRGMVTIVMYDWYKLTDAGRRALGEERGRGD
jgi:hypothetical protein